MLSSHVLVINSLGPSTPGVQQLSRLKDPSMDSTPRPSSRPRLWPPLPFAPSHWQLLLPSPCRCPRPPLLWRRPLLRDAISCAFEQIRLCGKTRTALLDALDDGVGDGSVDRLHCILCTLDGAFAQVDRGAEEAGLTDECLTIHCGSGFGSLLLEERDCCLKMDLIDRIGCQLKEESV